MNSDACMRASNCEREASRMNKHRCNNRSVVSSFLSIRFFFFFENEDFYFDILINIP